MHLKASDGQWDPTLNIKIRGVIIEKGLSKVGISHWLNFDGYRDLIKIPDRKELLAGESFSVAMWVCPRNHRQQGKQRSLLISKGWNSSSHGEFCLSLQRTGDNDGVLCLQVANLQDKGKKQIDSLHSKSVIPFDRWCHIAAVFDKGKMQIYINGHLESEKISEVKHAEKGEYPNNDISIGGLPWGNVDGYGFRGRIDDLRYYSKAIDSKLIADIFWGNMPTKPKQRRGDVEMESRLSSPFASVRFSAIHDYLALPEKRRQSIRRWYNTPSSGKEIDSLLNRLSSPEFALRQRATRRLILIGSKIIPRVTELRKIETDPEVRSRLKYLLETPLREKKCRVGLESIQRSKLFIRK